MIPVITGGGRSFRGAFLYYFHDKKAMTTGRVAWTHTLNMMTSCMEKAWKVMAFTYAVQERLKKAAGKKLSGRKLVKPVFAYSLSWHPEQDPGKEEMLGAARESLERLGLAEHEAAIVSHTDTEHPHVHVIVNRTHPLTGVAAKMNHSKRRLSDFAREYELKQGKVYCMQREQNYQQRREGKTTRYNDPVIVRAWQQSNDAHTFMELLENQGYDLAQGRRRLVVVDPRGKTHNPVRYLKGIATAGEFHWLMEGLDRTSLPTVDGLLAQRSIEEALENAIRPDELIQKVLSIHFGVRAVVADYHRGRIKTKRSELKRQFGLAQVQEDIDSAKDSLNKRGLLCWVANNVFQRKHRLTRKISRLERAKADILVDFNRASELLERERDLALKELDLNQSMEFRGLAGLLYGESRSPG